MASHEGSKSIKIRQCNENLTVVDEWSLFRGAIIEEFHWNGLAYLDNDLPNLGNDLANLDNDLANLGNDLAYLDNDLHNLSSS